MTKRRALISYAIGAVLVEMAVFTGLRLLDAGSETIGLAYVLLLCAAGFGVGAIFMRYPS